MSTTYAYTCSQAITAAFRKMGVYDTYTSSPTTTDLSNGMEALNLILKDWSIDLKIWLVNQVQLTLTAAKNQYVIGPSGPDLITDKPLSIVKGHRHQNDSGIDVPLTRLSRKEYDMLGLKTSTGPTTQIYYQPGQTSGTLWLYPTPDTYTATYAYLDLWVQTAIPDVINTTDVPVIPNEWYRTLVYAIAEDLMPEYRVPIQTQQMITLKAKELYQKLEDWAANEQVGTLFAVDNRGWA